MFKGICIILLFPLTLWLNAQNAGVGTLSPSSTFEVNGSLATKVITITGNTTLSSVHAVILCNSSSNFTVTLPTAVGISGRLYTIKNINTNLITILTTGGQTIDGLTSKFLTAQYNTVQLVSSGSNWYVLNEINAPSKPPSFLFATDQSVSNQYFVGLGNAASIFLRNTIVVPFNCELTSITFSIRDYAFNNDISATVWKNGIATSLDAIIIDGLTMLVATGTGSVMVNEGDLISIKISWSAGGSLSSGVAATVTYR